MKNIYDLKLHEELKVNDQTTVLRVASGWIYTVEKKSDNGRVALSTNLVPYTLERNTHIKEN